MNEQLRQPVVGDIVIFSLDTRFLARQGLERPGIVVMPGPVEAPMRFCGHVFLDPVESNMVGGRPTIFVECDYDESGRPGSWHWPS